jgi:uncharacterized protein with HEPN domain
LPSDTPITEREQAAWLAIRDNIHLAQSFVAGFTFESFVDDRKAFYAVTRCLEIISEASRRLRGPQQARFPELEWRQIEASGNVFRHAYDDVQERIVWTTVHDRLPSLLAAVIAAIASDTDD